jgi:hypothetical protein
LESVLAQAGGLAGPKMLDLRTDFYVNGLRDDDFRRRNASGDATSARKSHYVNMIL